MKYVTKIVLTLCIFCSLAFAQGKPKIAVYVTGGKDVNEDQALASRITNALLASRQYNAIERSETFLDQISKELVAQRSGSVDDRQISKIGQQSGANFVCIGEILQVLDGHQLSARIMNVESAEVIGSGVAAGSMKTVDDLAALSDKLVEALLANVGSIVGVNTFIDPRDNSRYRIRHIGNQTWLVQDLSYQQVKYTWRDAGTVCPNGWRLPGNADWQLLKTTASVQDMKEFARLSSGLWWSATGHRRTTAYAWGVSGGLFINDDLARSSAFAVRCVQD